jgi:hypothetical protein
MKTSLKYSKIIFKKKKDNELTVDEYNAMISSFAPKKLMFKWFKPYKCYVDMYDQAGQFKPKEVWKKF